jgi:hypothetical protein
MKFASRINSGYLFLLSFLIVFVVTPLFQQGVFGDGLMYLTVAFNRYKEHGSFWKQHYSATSMSFFCEQPPLYFESLNWCYKLFGGSGIAEKFFTLFLLLLTIFFTIKIWSRSGGNKQTAWFPALLLFCVPVFTWTFCNQVIETMVVPVSLCAFYLMLVFLQEKHTKKVFAFFGICGLMVVLFLTKGIQSEFLIVALFLGAITKYRKNVGRTFANGILIAVSVAGLFGLVFMMNEDALFWLKNYFDKRLVATFNNTGATASNHFDIIIRYFTELLPVFFIFILVSAYLVFVKKYSFKLQWKNFKKNRTAWWLSLISLSASFPLAVTLEQRGFYLSPSFPFIVLALCVFYKKYFFVMWSDILYKKGKFFFATGSLVLLFSLVFFISNKDGYKRDEGMIKDVAQMKKLFHPGEIIGINSSAWNTFSLHSYLNKANDNSLSLTDTARYFVQEKRSKQTVAGHYKKVNIPTFAVDIYRRRIDPK